MILVIGVGAFIVVFIVIILIISMSGNPDYDIKQSTTQTTTEESLNYDDVLGMMKMRMTHRNQNLIIYM